MLLKFFVVLAHLAVGLEIKSLINDLTNLFSNMVLFEKDPNSMHTLMFVWIYLFALNILELRLEKHHEEMVSLMTIF